MFNVVCIGILVADVITKKVDRLPERGKLGLVDNVQLYSGGCAMSAAIDLAKLGANAALMGCVGNDGFGGFLKQSLTDYSVNIDGLCTTDRADTSASVVLVDSGGERTFLHTRGANGVFTERDIDYSVIEKGKVIFVAGTMLMPSFDGEPCARMLKKAKDMGKITVLDTAWDDTGRWMNVLKPCMPFIDYFIPSIEEARELSKKQQPEEIADVFFDLGVGHVVIKLGKDGCYVRNTKGEEGIYIPTYSHIKPVDTTGAGDAFCSGFVYGLSKDMDIVESARLGNAVGTHCVMATGATSGIKHYDEIRAFMEDNK